VLQVRARVSKDLDNLRAKYIPELTATIQIPGRDYPYRGFATHEQVALGMARAVFDITYSNFKNEVMIEQGAERENLYHDVWNVMYNAESKLATARRKAEADRAWRREWEAKWAAAKGTTSTSGKGRGKSNGSQTKLPLAKPIATGYEAFPTLDDLDDLDVPPAFLENDGLISRDERGMIDRVLGAPPDFDLDPLPTPDEIRETAAAEEYIRSGGRRARKKANGARKAPAKRKARPTDEE
jgi:hypothetical protein